MSGQIHILIIEDNKVNRSIYIKTLNKIINDLNEEMFQSIEPHITQARNFETAQTILSQSSFAYDVVLLDRELGDGYGDYLFKSMTQHRLPNLFLLISSEGADLKQRLNDNASDLGLSHSDKKSIQDRLYEAVPGGGKNLDKELVKNKIRATFFENMQPRIKNPAVSATDPADVSPLPAESKHDETRSADVSDNTQQPVKYSWADSFATIFCCCCQNAVNASDGHDGIEMQRNDNVRKFL